MPEYQPSDRTVEDAITEKFKALIMRRAMATVRECLSQQFHLVECVTNFFAEYGAVHSLKS